MKVKKKTPHINTAMNGCIVTNTSIYPKIKITFPFQQNTFKFCSRTNHLRQFQEILQTAYCCFSQFPVKWSNVSEWIIQILIKTTKELVFNLVLICMFGQKIGWFFFYWFDSFLIKVSCSYALIYGHIIFFYKLCVYQYEDDWLNAFQLTTLLYFQKVIYLIHSSVY